MENSLFLSAMYLLLGVFCSDIVTWTEVFLKYLYLYIEKIIDSFSLSKRRFGSILLENIQNIIIAND